MLFLNKQVVYEYPISLYIIILLFISGHRYGNTLVPMTDDDKANMKYKAEKCFKVLGFTKAENVSPSVLVKMSLCMRKPTDYFQRLYRQVCVRPGRKPKLLVFSCTGSNVLRFCPLIITVHAIFCFFF